MMVLLEEELEWCGDSLVAAAPSAFSSSLPPKASSSSFPKEVSWTSTALACLLWLCSLSLPWLSSHQVFSSLVSPPLLCLLCLSLSFRAMSRSFASLSFSSSKSGLGRKWLTSPVAVRWGWHSWLPISFSKFSPSPSFPSFSSSFSRALKPIMELVAFM